MRILGIDPGLRTTGFGVLDAAGGQLAYVASGVIQTADAPQDNLPARLKLLYDGIGEICRRYAPDVAVVEIVFVNVKLFRSTAGSRTWPRRAILAGRRFQRQGCDGQPD